MQYGGVRISNVLHDYKGSINVLNKTCKWFEHHDLERIKKKIALHLNKRYMKLLLLILGIIAMVCYLWALYLEMKEKLEEKNFTYQTNDGIYFDTSKLKDYGKSYKLWRRS
jgi:cysteinyl-tRNA synthetase